MRRNIAEKLKIELGAVSVKATTTEWLGFTGREGIAAYTVVLLYLFNHAGVPIDRNKHKSIIMRTVN